MTGEFLHIVIGAERGGCERDALQLVRYVRTASHRVLVLDRDGPMVGDLREAGAVVEVLPASEISTNTRLISRVRDYAKAHPPAAAMCWHGLVWLPQLLYALRDIPGVVGVHGGNPAHSLSRLADMKFEALGRWYPRGPRVVYVCASQYIADSFRRSRYLNRFARVVIPNPVELPAGVRPRTVDRPSVIGMLARMDQCKDHATVIRAMPIVRRAVPEARLELAGGGQLEPALRQLVSDLGLEGYVVFRGQVANVYKAMAGWDVFAYATTELEGFGVALAEAMMLGLPPVVTDIGPIREVTGDPPAAVLVPPRDPQAMADALIGLLTEPEALRRLAARAEERAVEVFDPVRIARRYENLLMAAPWDRTESVLTTAK